MLGEEEGGWWWGSLIHICCYGWKDKEKAQRGLQVLIVSLAPSLLAAASCLLLILKSIALTSFHWMAAESSIHPPHHHPLHTHKHTHTNLSTTECSGILCVIASAEILVDRKSVV